MKALSVSELNLYYRDYPAWKNWYIHGIPKEFDEVSQRRMDIGSACHNWLEDNRYPIKKTLKGFGYEGKDFVKAFKGLNKANDKCYPEKEKIFIAETGSGVRILAKIDEFDQAGKMGDHKVTQKANPRYPFTWKDMDDPHKRFSYYNQLTFYALVYRLLFHKYPQEIRVNKIDLSRGTCKSLTTARGPEDLRYILGLINRMVAETGDLWEKRLDRKQRDLILAGKKQDKLSKDL